MTIRWGIQPELGGRVLRLGKWLPARAIGWVVALIFAIVLAFGPVMQALAHVLPNKPTLQFVAHAVGAIIVLAAYATLVRVGEQPNFHPAGEM